MNEQLEKERNDAWQRIGYLEEALRQIQDIALNPRGRSARDSRYDICTVASVALSTGDPATCPEAKP